MTRQRCWPRVETASGTSSSSTLNDRAYPDYWPDLVRVLVPRGLLAVDNVISHAEEVAAFRDLITNDHRVTDALAPTGAGALLVVRASC